MKTLILTIWILFFLAYSSYAEEVYKYGIASYYTVKSSSKLTASGEEFKENAFTCAIYDLKFGTMLKVTNIQNGKFVIVEVTDRGPHKRLKRAIDLTPIAFKQIADLKQGLISVKIEVIK